MQRFKKRIISYFIMIVFAVTLIGCQSKSSTTNETEKKSYKELEVGDEAPDFEVELLDGEKVALSDYLGKVVLLNFWATWCSPCVEEMPDIQELSKAYPDDVVVLAVNCNEEGDTVRSFIQEKGFTFPIGLDEKGEITTKYPTDGIPYTVIINGDGIIQKIHLGGGEGMYSVFEEDIEAILAK